MHEFGYVCTHTYIHTPTAERLGNNDNPITESIPSTRILDFLIPFSTKKKKLKFLREMANCWPGVK